jgi:hypothetical protein
VTPVCAAADLDAGTVFYSDVDHIVRWAEQAPDELAEAVSGVRALSRAAIDEIVATDGEDTAANDVTWVYRALRGKLDVAYVEVRGLDYEDQQQFGRPERGDDFRRRIESDPANWLARVRIAEQMVGALVRLSSPPPNSADGRQTAR